MRPEIGLQQAAAASPRAEANTPALPAAPTPADTRARPNPPTLGQRVGAYELWGHLDSGGMGEVYRATHAETGEEFALKLLRADRQLSARVLQSMKAEIKAAQRLSHPNILPILDSGEHDGAPYFVMPLVAGGSLEGQLRAGRTDLRAGVELLALVARAVHAAHQKGVIHRDLKPGNILLGAGGAPLVADFGLARFLDQTTGFTMTGEVFGSPDYMAPEQAAGQGNRATAATDVWPMGVMLYELLTGQRPFRGDTVVEVMENIRGSDPVAPSRVREGVPADLETVCLRCLRKHPGKRYRSMNDLADDLERWLGGEAIAPAPVQGSRLASLRALGGLLGVAWFLALAAPPSAQEQASPDKTALSALRGRLSSAAPGRPVALLDKDRAPIWGRFAAGEGQGKFSRNRVRGPWLYTSNRCLFELLPPDPARGDFRLLVELSQEDGEAYSEVGLYAYHSQKPAGENMIHAFFQATFCEAAFKTPAQRPLPDPLARPAFAGFIELADGDIPSHRTQIGLQIPLGTALRRAANHPVRQLCLEVRHGNLAVIPAGREPVPVGPGLLNPALARLDRKRALQRSRPELTPAAGAGLVIWRGGITIHRVLYEPLPARH